MKNIIVCSVFAILSTLLFLGCDEFDANSAQNPDLSSDAEIRNPTNYSSNIYYFPCIQSCFGRSLSRFVSSHPNLELVSMTGDGTWAQGVDQGYWVYFKARQ